MLKIENHQKIMGDTFCNDRFLCCNFEETNNFLAFWFKDTNDRTMAHKGHWVRIERERKWDAADQKWYYEIQRPDSKKHYITADWFADIDNARAAFEDVLKELI